MPTLVPIQEQGLFVQRYAAHLAVDVTKKMGSAQANLSADISSGDGTMVFIDAISEILDSAR